MSLERFSPIRNRQFVAIHPFGGISFSASLSKAIGDRKFCELFFDRAEKVIVIRLLNNASDDSFVLSRGQTGGVTFCPKSFWKWTGFQLDTITGRHEVDINEDKITLKLALGVE